MENNLTWHHKNKVTEEEIQSLLAELEDLPDAQDLPGHGV